MVKSKLISLVLAGTVTGGGVIAGVVSQINSNTQKATKQITQSTNDLRLASGAIDTAQKTIVSQNDKIQVISNKQEEAATNLAVAQKDVATQTDTIASLKKELATKNANIADLQKKLKTSEGNASFYKNENIVITQQLSVANAAVGQLQQDLANAGTVNSKLQKELTAEQAKVADLQKKLKYSEETTQVYINETDVLRQQVWAANTAVGMLQNNLDAANTNLATANKNLATRTKEVASLQKEITSLKAELSIEEAKNAAQASDINKLKDAVNNQTKAIDSAATDNNAAQASFQKSLASLNQTVKK